MIEMLVRAVTTHPQTGRSVAVLEARAGDAPALLALGLTRAEACSLSHELAAKPTMRQQSLALLARCLESRDARIVAVRILPGAAGMASARIDLAWPDGPAETAVETGQALGLAVALRVPLLVAEALLAEHQPTTNEPLAASGVPAAFRRAFDV